MTTIKSLSLKNYCGFKEINLDFTDSDNLVLLYGPNGCGKTTILQAINMLSSPKQMRCRDLDITFRQLTYHPDYIPGYEALVDNDRIMEAEIVFDSDGKEQRVRIEGHNNKVNKKEVEVEGKKIIFQEPNTEKTKSGIYKDEIPKEVFSHCQWIDADNPSHLQRFQMEEEYKDIFLELAEAVYNFKCEIPEGSIYGTEEQDPTTGEYITYYTDFIVHKVDRDGNVNKTHYKKMSAGERKIAKLLSELCNPSTLDKFDIILIDNIEMHIYFKRHLKLIKKLKELFPDKQFIATTHSGTLVDQLDKKYLFDMENIKEKKDINFYNRLINFIKKLF